MKRIAIPISNNNLSHHFQHCETFAIYEVEDDMSTYCGSVSNEFGSIDEMVNMLRSQQVDVVIAQHINEHTIELLAQHKIQVYIEVNNNDPEKLLVQLMDGQLFSGRYEKAMFNN